MKNKSKLIISVFVLAVLFCITLCSCVPSRPDNYIDQLLVSEKWGLTLVTDDSEKLLLAQNKNIRVDFGAKKNTYLVKANGGLDMFVHDTEKDSWIYEFHKEGEASYKNWITAFKDNVSKEELAQKLPDFEYARSDFKSKFEKIDGKWYERNTSPACWYVKDKKLYYEKGTTGFIFDKNFIVNLPEGAKKIKQDYLADRNQG